MRSQWQPDSKKKPLSFPREKFSMRIRGVPKAMMAKAKKSGIMAAASVILPLMLFFSPGKVRGALAPFRASYDFPVPDDWILQAPERLMDPFRNPYLNFDGEVFGADIKGPLGASAGSETGAAPSGNTYGNSASEVLSSPRAPERRSVNRGSPMLPERTSLWLEEGATGYSPVIPPDYDEEGGVCCPAGQGPDSGGKMSQKMWRLSGEDTVFYNMGGNYDFPYGRLMDAGKETYNFNTSLKYETARLAPVVLDAQATGGYLPGTAMPLGFQLTARSAIQKATVSGSYGMSATSMDFDSMTPVVHHFSGNLGYKLTPVVDVNGEVTYVASDLTPEGWQTYQGGLNWRPSVADMIASSVKLTDSGPAQSYDIFTSYQRKLASSGDLFSFNSDFSRDLFHFIHENLTLAYAWKWGRCLLNAAFGTTMNEAPGSGGILVGKTFTLGITRTFGTPVAGIF